MSHHHCQGSGHSHHSCCGDKSCSCCHGHIEASSACHGGSCEISHHQDAECSFADELLALADEAWMEVLHDKIKAQIEASSGKQLDQLAKLVASANKDRWKQKLAIQKIRGDYKAKIGQFFSGDKS